MMVAISEGDNDIIRKLHSEGLDLNKKDAVSILLNFYYTDIY